jgi:prepilin-type processing-associated H-X9-DG protein
MKKSWGWNLSRAVILAFLGFGAALAADEPKAKAMPADLSTLPRSALAFVSFRVADLWNNELAKTIRAVGAENLKKTLKEIEETTGLKPGDVERVTVVFQDQEEPRILSVVTKKPYDQDKLVKGMSKGKAEEETYKGKTLFKINERFALLPLTNKIFLGGNLSELKVVLDKEASKPGGLEVGLQAASGKHGLVAGVNPAVVKKMIGERIPPAFESLMPMLEAKSAVLIADPGISTKATMTMIFADEKSAKKGAEALGAARKLGLGFLSKGIKSLTAEKTSKELVEFLGKVEKEFKNAPIKQDGTAVTLSTEMKFDKETFEPIVKELAGRLRLQAARLQSVNNLKQLALAMHNYHDVTGRFPANAIFDKEGKPLLSWRVLLLPYLGHQDLYDEFHLNEPWNSKHNSKLLAKMPALYAVPVGETSKKHLTFYQAFVGKGSVFDGKRGIKIQDIQDGTSNTIMFVEAGKAVPWSKPDDIPFDENKAVPKIGAPFGPGFNAAFCDGSVRFFRKMPKQQTMKFYITRSGGEVIPETDD